jgi:hypothetical protein
MSMTDTTPLAAAALLVLEKEMLYTDARANRQPWAVPLSDLLAAQAAYEAEILLRTTPTGQLSPP